MIAHINFRADNQCSLLLLFFFLFTFREKKREREREELWKRLHELADEIHIQKGDRIGLQGLSLGAQQSNSDHTSNNQNNMQGAVASSTQSHSAGPTGISTQMNSMSISGTAAMSK